MSVSGTIRGRDQLPELGLARSVLRIQPSVQRLHRPGECALNVVTIASASSPTKGNRLARAPPWCPSLERPDDVLALDQL